MKKVLRALSVSVLSVLLVISLMGCVVPTPAPANNGSNEPAPTAGGSVEPTKPASPVTISVEVFDRSNAPEGGGTLTDSFLTRYIADNFSKNTNININWVPIPRSQEVDKLQVLMAGGTAPDIVFTYAKDVMFNYAKDGGLTEITADLMSNAPNLQEYLGEVVLNDGKYLGKQYAIVAKRALVAEHNSWIRKDLLDKLGLPLPTTTQELYDTLKIVMEKDPGDVGKDKIVAYGMHGAATGVPYMNYLQLLLSFSVPDASDEDWNVLPSFMFSGAKEGFRLLNKMYNEGMISNDFALDDTSKKFNEDIVMGRTVFFTESVNSPLTISANGLLLNLQKNVPGAELVPIDTHKNASGKYLKHIYSPTGMYIMIPKTSKHPAEALKYLDWMSQNIIPLTYGTEGVHYTLVDGIPVFKDPDLKKKDLWSSGDVCIVANGTDLGTLEKNIKASVLSKAPFEDLATEGLRISLNDGKANIPFDVPIESEMKYGPNLKKIEQELVVRSITVKIDEFDKTYDELLDKWLSSGGQDVVNEKRAAYQRLNSK